MLTCGASLLYLTGQIYKLIIMTNQSATSVAFETLIDNFGEDLLLDFYQDLKEAMDIIKSSFTPKKSGVMGWVSKKIRDENKVQYENMRIIGIAESLKIRADGLILIYSPKILKLKEVLNMIKGEKFPVLSCEASNEILRTYSNVAVQENLIRIQYFDTLVDNLKKVSATIKVLIQQMQLEQDITETLNAINLKKDINK